MRDIKLIALDLDGTLLDRQKHISPRNAAALARAAEQGAEIVVASGRYYLGVPEELRSQPYIRYFICINGAAVFDTQTGQALLREEIDLARAQEIYDELDKLDVIYDCYQGDEGWMDTTHHNKIEEYVLDPGIRKMIYWRKHVDNFRQVLNERGRPLQKIQAFFREGAPRDAAMARLAKQFPDMAVTTSLQYNIEINSRAANKGAALRALAEHLGLRREQVMAFGDGTNDITMLQYAGIGVAMENGAPETKAAADRIAPHHEKDGVAQVLEEYFPPKA